MPGAGTPEHASALCRRRTRHASGAGLSSHASVSSVGGPHHEAAPKIAVVISFAPTQARNGGSFASKEFRDWEIVAKEQLSVGGHSLGEHAKATFAPARGCQPGA